MIVEACSLFWAMVLSDGLLRLDFAMRALYGRAFQTARYSHSNTGPRIRAGVDCAG